MQHDYIQQFVDRIEDLLEASLARETWPVEQQRCLECTSDLWAVWRCIDCTLSQPLCRKCMRHTHFHSPLHRIECWTGTYFRRASLWEVGTYVLVRHHKGEGVCSSLQFKMQLLEDLQLNLDV